jgi:two-component sensor histidine kinase
MGSTAPAASVEIELASEAAAPGHARSALAPLRASLQQHAYDDLCLVVSELVTNSVVHGPGTPIRLSVNVDEAGNASGEVADDGDAVIDVGRTAAGAEGGRGLALVDLLTARWGVYEGSTHVWFELGARPT